MENLYTQAKEAFFHATTQETMLEAKKQFEQLGDYKDSTNYLKKCDIWLKFSLGNTVTYGNYKGRPLEWTVMEVSGKVRLLLANDNIAFQPFNLERDNTYWSTSHLRQWLNHDFINEAFTMAERMSIMISKLKNPASREWNTYCGPDTKDKVFVFSHEEIDQYLPNPADRGLEEWWWTRTMGYILLAAACVYTDGSVYDLGINIHEKHIGVRPAIRIMLR